MKSITVVIQVQRKNKWLESNAHSLGFFVDFYFYSLLLLLDYYFWTPSLMNHFKYPNADMFWSQTVGIKSRDPSWINLLRKSKHSYTITKNKSELIQWPQFYHKFLTWILRNRRYIRLTFTQEPSWPSCLRFSTSPL